MRIDLEDGIHLHVHSAGSGERTTLFLHGWAMSGRVWAPVLARWPDGAGRALAVDLRGAGWSSKPREGYTLDAYVRDIVGVIDRLGLRELALVGHSMGGTIAQRVALARPDALRRLVLLSPVPASGMAIPAEQVAFFRSLMGHRQGAEQTLRMMLGREPSPELFEQTVEAMATVVVEAVAGGFDAWRTADFAGEIGAIRTPTVVIGGALEQVLSPALMQSAVVGLIPGATWEEIPGVGHYPQLECPDELLARLIVALSDAEASA